MNTAGRVAKKFIAISNSKIERLIRDYDSCCLECDGMTRVIHTVLEKHGIRHTVMVGTLTDVDTDETVPLHYWIELPNKDIIDYRAQMWLGSFAPHGIFDPDDEYSYEYRGRRVRMPVLDDRMFMILTGGCQL